MITSSVSMSMVGGTSLRMSPSRSRRHTKNLSTDFKRQMVIKAQAQARYERQQLLLTRSMQTKLKQKEDRQYRQQLRSNAKLTQQRQPRRQRPASASNASARRRRGVRTKSGTATNPRMVYQRLPSYVHDVRQNQRPEWGTSPRMSPKRPSSAQAKTRISTKRQQHVNWQIIGARVSNPATKERQLRRPKSAHPGGRRDPQPYHVYAPTIISARMSPRSLKKRRPKSADRRVTRVAQTQTQVTQQYLQRSRTHTRPHSAGRQRIEKKSQTSVVKSDIRIPTANGAPLSPEMLSVYDTIDSPDTSPRSLPLTTATTTTPSSSSNTTTTSTTKSTLIPAAIIREIAREADHMEFATKTVLNNKTTKSITKPSWSLKPRSRTPSAAAKAKSEQKIHNDMRSVFGTVQFSAISAACQQIAGTRKWHLTAIEFLTFCQHDLGISSMTLSEAQMLCCNRPLGQGGFENVFNARAYCSVFGGKSNKEIDPTIGEIKSVAVVEWETTVGCGAFHLEYADFRDRFWVPIHKTIKTVIDKLAKEQKTKKSKKNQNNQIDDKSNGGDLEDIASDSSSTWLPKVEHYDGEHYINDHMNTKDICLEHIKVARRMKRLYISIRRGIKRRHLSCAVAFSSFALSMDPILSLSALQRAARNCAPQVLSLPAIHLKESEFVHGLSSLAAKFITNVQHDCRSRIRRIKQWKTKKLTGGVSKYCGATSVANSVDLLETRTFLQWLCLNRFDSVITI